MAPSVAQLAPETVNAPEVKKRNIEAQQVKTDNVCNIFRITAYFFVYVW